MTLPTPLRSLLPLMFGAAVALSASSLVPPATHEIGPARVELNVQLGTGRTVVEVPPFGTITAATHSPILDLQLRLTDLDPRALVVFLEGAAEGRDLASDLESSLRDAVLSSALRWVLAATVMGGLASALLPRRSRYTILIGAAGGTLAMAAAFLLGARTYDLRGFDEPRYSGILERAPQFIQAVHEESGTISGIPTRFKTASIRLVEVLKVLSEPLPPQQAGSVVILHISDVHSNPIGLEIAKQLVAQFDAAAVIDTGDLTSFGDPAESVIAGAISTMGVPYLFIPGNHDSPANRQALKAIPGVRVLEGAVEEVAGVRILGWPDPSFTASKQVSQEEADKAQAEASDEVESAVGAHDPDILAVHNPKLAELVAGEVPTVLSGHSHRRGIAERRGTWFLTVGSTGATGLGSFLIDDDLPYEAQVIYLQQGEAVAVDYIRFTGFGRDFQIDRRSLVS